MKKPTLLSSKLSIWQGIKSIRVVSGYTDVFVLLLYYYTTQQLTCNLVMTGTSYDRTSDDIKVTAEKHSDIIPYLLAAQVLSGCDTVAYPWGIGKVTVVKVLSSGKQLRKLGDLQLQLVDVISECILFGMDHWDQPT